MTDEITPQTQPPPKKDEKKPASSGNNRGPKRNTSNSRTSGGGPAQGGPRPTSRTSNKKPSNNASAAESGSDTTSRKGSEGGKKPEQRNKTQGNNNNRPQPHRKAQPPSSFQGGRGNTNKDQAAGKSASPGPAQGKDTPDALSSLQRVIADLKTTSPPIQPAGNTNTFSLPQGHTSNLPINAPVFQPGAAAYPGNNVDPKHRKASSVGAAGLSGNFNSFSPGLGAMMEEEGGGHLEDGEIQDQYYPQGGHQPRAQSQSFMAPRFAALAAQQEQVDSVGPTGRPQLAPGFMFGARKRGGPMGAPINEEDAGFQFPQQQQQQNFQQDIPAQESHHRKTDSGEITGIMAEQVRGICDVNDMFLMLALKIALQTQIEQLQQQQQALYQQQLASNQVLSFQTPGLAPNRGAAHRRVQSTVPMGMGAGPGFGAPQQAMGQFGLGNLGLEPQQQGIPRGHGRRHSVNVVNKPGVQPGGSISYNGNPYAEGYEDGFGPPAAGFNGHSRQASRADSSWRISE